MFRDLGDTELRTGEHVNTGVVLAPDEQWATRIEQLLAHKGDPWNWQNSEVLRCNTGINARFYVLHRGGDPFANIMTAEVDGVGILGHVWTKPEDRRKGAISRLMTCVMSDFRDRAGQALCLGTVYDSPPYHIYRNFGFQGIEPASDYMTYYSTSPQDFAAHWFGPGPKEMGPLCWRDWPALPFLFVGDFPGVVRCAPAGLIGRVSSEEGLIPLLRNPKRSRAIVLRKKCSGAAMGLAVCMPDRVWPNTVLVDVYCNPRDWSYASELLAWLQLPSSKDCIAYDDTAIPEKSAVLKDAGFSRIAVLKDWIPVDAARTRYTDVEVMRRPGRLTSPVPHVANS